MSLPMNHDLPSAPDGHRGLSLPGRQLARGVARLMREMNHAALLEFTPTRGLRVDVMAVTASGELWIIECKSSRSDFTSDRKWQGYLDWCDRFFWAVDSAFPVPLLPPGDGLILASPHAAEVVQMAPLQRLAAARRNRLLRDFARCAAWRLQGLTDTGARLARG